MTLSQSLILLLAISPLLHSTPILSDYKISFSCFYCSRYNYYALLEYKGSEDFYLNLTNPIIPTLQITICFTSHSHVTIQILDPITPRWQVPLQDPFPFTDPLESCLPPEDTEAYFKSFKDPFYFQIFRRGTNELLFDSSAGQLIFSDLYIQLSTFLPTQNLYGLAERAFPLDLGTGGTFTLFTKDQPRTVENATSGHNLYGYHPAYLQREESNNFSLVLMRSSNAMDVVIEKNRLTYKILGGIIDLNIFFGERKSDFSPPETVVRQYHRYLGGWLTPPFWAMGYHQSKWGYEDLEAFKGVLSSFQAYEIPVDVMWSDLDHMEFYINGRLDERRYPRDRLKRVLHDFRVRWVPIFDAGIGVRGNPDLDQGIMDEVFVKNPNGNPFIGKVWPGDVVFIDFFHPKADGYWAQYLENLYRDAPFSGVWLDMNELANFVDGDDEWSPAEDDILNRPPYIPAGPGQMLYNKTVRLDALHFGGLTEFNVHNLYGLMQAYSTYKYLLGRFKMPFILSRATSFGSGRYSFHWTGDNAAEWEFLRLSLPQVMTMNILGIPFVGPDVCGFDGNATEALCARWYQAATFYPFFRNHNILWGLPQEPYALGPTVMETAKMAIELRYSVAKYYYGLFLKAEGLGTIFRPLFFEFYEDLNLYERDNKVVDSQFLIGDALMVAPVLEENEIYKTVYFPEGLWFDFFTGQVIQKDQRGVVGNVQVYAPLNRTVPLFIRGGYLVAKQRALGVRRIEDLSGEFEILAAVRTVVRERWFSGYYAEGSVLGVSDMDESNVKDRCIDHECVYDVKAYLVHYRCGMDLRVSFEPPLKEKLENEEIYVTKIVLYGDWNQNFYRSTTAALGSEKAFVRNGQPGDGDFKVLFKNSRYFSVKFGRPVRIQKRTVLELYINEKGCFSRQYIP